MADNIEELIQKLRDLGDLPKVVVTLATVLGIVFVIYYSIRLLHSLFNGLRLYILNQYCLKTDFVKKYGKWAIVTGATDGIGLSMVKELAQRGHSVIVIGRSKDKLSQVKATLEAQQNVGEVVTIKIDLSDSSVQNYEKIRGKIDAENREIGILINNAGTFFGHKGFTRFSQDDSRTIINVNVLAPIYFTRMVLPSMLKRKKGLIVNVSSLLGFVNVGYDNTYGATKTFVNKFGEMLQDELTSYPIDVVTLTPGSVITKLSTSFTTISKPNLFSPSADDYARSAINAVATPLSTMAGSIGHGIFVKFCLLANPYATSAMLRLAIKLTSRNFEPTQAEGDSLATVSTSS